jgi:hypothetical protein
MGARSIGSARVPGVEDLSRGRTPRRSERLDELILQVEVSRLGVESGQERSPACGGFFRP